jgi:type II restriction enzyme
MRLDCDKSIADHLTSATQRARVITESWVASYGYCLSCDSDKLTPTRSNTPARDFRCDHCGHSYELKSSKSSFGNRIVDGAYSSMVRRMKENTTPTLLLLEYSPVWNIKNFVAIHHSFITPLAIECRPPLSLTARRAGWVGCNIVLKVIPPEARVRIVEDCKIRPVGQVRQEFGIPERLSECSINQRSWAGATLSLIHQTLGTTFTVQEAYSMEHHLSRLYPENKNVRAKIRQQLQVLRDAGILSTEERGVYSVRRQDNA